VSSRRARALLAANVSRTRSIGIHQGLRFQAEEEEPDRSGGGFRTGSDRSGEDGWRARGLQSIAFSLLGLRRVRQ